MNQSPQPATITIIFATITSLAALCSIYLTVRGQRLQRQGAHYQLAVADPVHEYLRQFVDELMKLLSGGLSEVERISRDGGKHLEVTQNVQRLLEEVKERWSTLKWRVLAGVKAWGDDDLERGVHRVLEDLEDAIARAVADLAVGTEPARTLIPHLREALETHATRMLQLVIEHDPALRKMRWAFGRGRAHAPAQIAAARAAGLRPVGQ